MLAGAATMYQSDHKTLLSIFNLWNIPLKNKKRMRDCAKRINTCILVATA